MMAFSDTHLEGVTIGSVWRREKITKENESQTHDIEYIERGVQHISMNNTETQTSDLMDIHFTRPLKTFNSPELTKFVIKASEITIEEIKKVKSNDVFQRIARLQSDGKAKAYMSRKFICKNDFISETSDGHIQYIVSSLCWNSKASVLAVTLKASQHNDWCTHESYLLLWSLYKTSKSDEPSIIVETDSCGSVISSHPTQPSIYCLGALNGKISLLDTRNTENEMIFASVMAHQSRVSHIDWFEANKRSDLGQLVSSGLDGKVFIWRIHDKSISLENAFVILAQDMPRTIPIKGDKNEVEVGIVSMSFNCEDPNIFIIGTIGGAIFQCSLLSAKRVLNKSNPTIVTKQKSVEYKNPIAMSYASHRSHINVVQFSPVSRNIFFSCGSDSELRIYNILQTVPLVVIHTDVPLVSGQWSPLSPNIATVGADGKVYVFTINDTNVSNASFSFSMAENISAKSLVYDTFESNERIAVITSNNEIQFWDLSLTSQKNDRKHINDILRGMTSDESENP